MGRRSLRSLLALGACAAGLAAVPAAGTPDERPAAGETTPPRLVDEWRGRFDGVRIGHTSRGIRRRLGQPLPRGDGQITPSHIDSYEVGGPTFFASPPMLRGRNAGGALRYQEGSFFMEGGRAYGFMTVAQGARTREGVAIGDPASRVLEQLPPLALLHRQRGHRVGDVPALRGRAAQGRPALLRRRPDQEHLAGRLERPGVPPARPRPRLTGGLTARRARCRP
jgi:hypothetical protein